MLIMPMKKEIIQSHNMNIDTPGSFHSIKLKTGLYASELSLIIPINPRSGSSGDAIMSTVKSNFWPSLSTDTSAVSPGFKLGKSIGLRIGMSLIDVMMSLANIPALSAPESSMIDKTKTPCGSS